MKPRNHLVAHAMKRKAGAHVKTNKATRRKEKMEVNKMQG